MADQPAIELRPLPEWERSLRTNNGRDDSAQYCGEFSLFVNAGSHDADTDQDAAGGENDVLPVVESIANLALPLEGVDFGQYGVWARRKARHDRATGAGHELQDTVAPVWLQCVAADTFTFSANIGLVPSPRPALPHGRDYDKMHRPA